LNKILKDTIIITVITLVSGCLLGLVYEITKDPIAKAQYNAQQDAYKAVFESAESFEDYGSFAEDSDAVVTLVEFPETDVIGTVEAKDKSGETIGYVITTVSHSGYGGDITLSVGVQMDGTLNGYAITSISETAGLGMKAKDEKFTSQFENKLVDSFAVTKDTPASDNQIEAISGATITSDAVTDAVNAGLAYFQRILEGGA